MILLFFKFPLEDSIIFIAASSSPPAIIISISCAPDAVDKKLMLRFVGDFIFRKKHSNFVFKNNIPEEIKFDWIIGNPPWGSKLNEEEIFEIRNNYKIGKGEINSYTAFKLCQL